MLAYGEELELVKDAKDENNEIKLIEVNNKSCKYNKQ